MRLSKNAGIDSVSASGHDIADTLSILLSFFLLFPALSPGVAQPRGDLTDSQGESYFLKRVLSLASYSVSSSSKEVDVALLPHETRRLADLRRTGGRPS